MTIQLSAEEQQAMEKVVANGQFTSVDEAVHAAVRNMSDEYAEWLVYARRQVQLGLDDIAAGRVIDGAPVMQRLRQRARKSA